jgi:hypothetical protein
LETCHPSNDWSRSLDPLGQLLAAGTLAPATYSLTGLSHATSTTISSWTSRAVCVVFGIGFADELAKTADVVIENLKYGGMTELLLEPGVNAEDVEESELGRVFGGESDGLFCGDVGFHVLVGGNRHSEHLAAGVSMWNAPILVALFWH